LWERSVWVASLLPKSVSPGVTVAVLRSRSPISIVDFLAILGRGAAYLPLSPSLSDGDIQRQLKASGAAAVVCSRDLKSRAEGWGLAIVCDEEILADLRGPAGNLELNLADAASPAYVMFTSGSTGAPKAVVVPHSGVLRLVVDPDYISLSERDVIPLFAPLSFDASTFEIWGALLNGGCLWVPRNDPVSLGDIQLDLRSQGLSVVWLTAGLFNLLIDSNPSALSSTRVVLTGGEAMSVPHARRFFEACPNTELINGYGPTENTTFSTCHRVVRTDLEQSRVPIGRPIRGTTAYVIDESLRVISEFGREGELVVAGPGLAIGYANDAELTAARFMPLTLPDSTLARVYRTGDRVVWLPDGTLDFLGRLDGQVKVRGFRIELSELDFVFSTCPGVRQAAAFAKKLDAGHLQLGVALVLEPGRSEDEAVWRNHAELYLPTHARPVLFLPVNELPLNANGKVDRRALVMRVATAPAANTSDKPVATYSYLHSVLLKIWSEIFPHKSVTLESDFVQLGGDSLLAMRMLVEVEKELGVQVPLQILLECHTPSQLAAGIVRLKTSQSPSRFSRLTESRPGGELYFSHGDFVGGGFGCVELARHPEQPFSFIATDAPTNRAEYPESVDADAQSLLAAMPSGYADPRWFGGHCNGALVALALANASERIGKTVSGVLLLEPPSCFFPRLRPLLFRVLSGLGIRKSEAEFCSVVSARALILASEAWLRRSSFFDLRALRSAWRTLLRRQRLREGELAYYQRICCDFEVPQLECPVQLVFVAAHPGAEARLRRRWKRWLPQAELIVYDASHSLMMSEKKGEIARGWSNFALRTKNQKTVGQNL
jgi:amino acid adenylation domain-containing protein